MIGGAKPVRPDHRDHSFSRTFGALSPLKFPDEYDCDAGYGCPDQVADGFPMGCFPKGTPILMEDMTYLPIEQVSVGDVVFTHKGKKRKVTKTYKREYNGSFYSIRFRGDYRKITATKEHPFFVVKNPRKEKGKPPLNKDIKISVEEIEAQDLSIGDFVVFPKLKGLEKDTSIRVFERDPEFLWVLGLYIAEGCTIPHGVQFWLNINETEYAERVSKVMSKYGADVRVYRDKKKNTACIYLMGKKWAGIFEELGGKGCANKRITTRLMCLPPTLLMAVVDGVFAGDGHERSRGVLGSTINSFCMTSYELLVQIRRILMQNDIYSSFLPRKDREGRKPTWSLEYVLNGNRKNYLEDKDNFYVPVTELEKSNRELVVYNLEVEEDNSYLVDGVAVHNCTGYTQTELCQDEDDKEYDPEYTYRRSLEMDGSPMGSGVDIRTSLKSTITYGVKEKKGKEEDAQKNRRGQYFNVVDSPELDAFDDIRSALLMNKEFHRPVSVGTPWFVEWNNDRNGIIPEGFTYNGADKHLWHNWKISGWKVIKGKTYLIGKTWQGKRKGDKGFHYFSRETINAVMKLTYTGAFTLAKAKPGDIANVRLTVLNTLLSFFYRIKAYIESYLTTNPLPDVQIPTMPPLPEPPVYVPTNREKLYDISKACIGKEMSPKDLASDDYGCVESLEGVYRWFKGKYISGKDTPLLSTYALYVILKDHPDFVQVTEPMFGDICVYATNTVVNSPIKNGHCFILGKNQWMSNNSETGLWDTKYTAQTAKAYYEVKGGYTPHYFRCV